VGWADLETTVDERVGALIRERDLPGVVVAVTKAGRLVLAKGYGYAYRDGTTSVPMRPSTRVKIGSTTKATVTGPATWQLLQAKHVDPATTSLYGPGGLFEGRFDDDIEIGVQNGLEAGTPGAADWADWYRRVTIQHLLDHEAGFTKSGDEPGAAAMFGVPLGEHTYEHVHRHFLRTRPLLFEPGTRSEYSNHGMGLQTLVVEQLAGVPFPEYVREEYLKPLGLHHAIRPERATPDSCDAYRFKSNDPDAPAFYEFADSGPGLAAGGFMASMPGIARLLTHLEETYTTTELDRMGWGRTTKGKLQHNGRLGGGTSHVAMFPDGYVSNGGVDLSRVHVAVATNRWTSTGSLRDLASAVALAAAEAGIPGSYDLWDRPEANGSCEYTRYGVPATEYQAVFDEAVSAGYRLEWVDGYTEGGRVHFNAIFRTDEPAVEWVSHHNLTDAAYQRQFDRYVSEGYSLTHVDSYAVGRGVRYAAVWTKSGDAFTAYHGKTTAAHQAAFDSLTKQGWRPSVISVTSAGGAPRYTALYTRRPIGRFEARSSLTPRQYQDAFDRNVAAGRHLHYLNGYTHRGEPRFTAIWAEKPLAPTFRARHGLTGGRYERTWRDALGDGATTRAITGYEDGGVTRFAAYWTR
jgi:CubicO group peptidase (beta-lactamase class C family)